MDDSQDSLEFRCSICQRALKHKFSLERHVKVVHGGKRPHQCECGKLFATKEQLTRHRNSKHTNQKPYACQKGCDKSFASYSARAYHHSAIHDQLRFPCPMIGCEKQYSSKVHLDNHLKQPHAPQKALMYLISHFSYY